MTDKSQIIDMFKVEEKPKEIAVSDEKENSNIKKLDRIIEVGTSAIEELKELATDTQHPRAYEALGSLMRAVTDAAKAHDQIKNGTKFGKDSPLTDGEKQIHNHLHMTQSELLDFMKNKNKDEN